MKVLVTGSTGFLGSQLCDALRMVSQLELVAVVRKVPLESCDCTVVIPDLESDAGWADALSGQDVVIHAAARAHAMVDKVADPLAEYRRVNVDGTLKLARRAAAAGVKRFVFISTIKVNGERSQFGNPFAADEDVSSPVDPYALSKWEAEQGLRNIAESTDLEIVIIRPPLIYGPGAKGNIRALVALIEKRLPLPLGSLRNLRSMVSVDNLVDLIISCIGNPNAANKTFLVSDDQDLSISEFLTKLGEAAGKPANLFPFPPSVLKLGAILIGKQSLTDRLLGNLQVDITHTKETLDWAPPISVEEGLRRCFEPTNTL